MRHAASATAALARTGIVDDGRYARLRAAALAERGWGNEGIRFKLERQGLREPEVVAALDALDPEPARARAIVARRGASRRTLAYLAGRGFDPDVAEAALALDLAD